MTSRTNFLAKFSETKTKATLYDHQSSGVAKKWSNPWLLWKAITVMLILVAPRTKQRDVYMLVEYIT